MNFNFSRKYSPESIYNSQVIKEAFKKFCLRHALLPDEVGVGKMSRTMDYKVNFPKKEELKKIARETYGSHNYVKRKFRSKLLGRLGYPS